MCLLCFLAQVVAAAGESRNFARLVQDFMPISTLVIKAEGNTVILDKGRQAGVHTGDLFRVYAKGAPVKGPGKGIIGYLKRPVATLMATRIMENRTKCRILGRDNGIRSGMPAVRYSDLRAVFVSKQSDNSSTALLEKRLEQDLPDLKWLDVSQVPSAISDARSMRTLDIDILFLDRPSGLEVYGPGMKLLHRYNVSTILSLATRKEEKPQSHRIRTSHELVPIRPGRGVLHIDLQKAVLKGQLPAEALQVEINDMDGDGRPECLYLFPTALYITAYGQPGPVSSLGIQGPGEAINFSTMPGTGWIALNVLVKGVGMRSLLLNFHKNSLAIAESEINLWLAFKDSNGDGHKDIFLGQGFDKNLLFSPKTFRLEPGPGGISYVERLNFPKGFSLTRATWADLNRDQVPELIFIDSRGILRIYQNDVPVWNSPVCLEPRNRQGMAIDFVEIHENDSKTESLVFPGLSIDGPRSERMTFLALGWIDGQYAVSDVTTTPIKDRLAGLFKMNGSLFFALTGRGKNKEGGRTLLYLLPSEAY